MLQIIRKGDKTTHGGSVMTCSDTMIFGGIGVARKGDMVSCPIRSISITAVGWVPEIASVFRSGSRWVKRQGKHAAGS